MSLDFILGLVIGGCLMGIVFMIVSEMENKRFKKFIKDEFNAIQVTKLLGGLIITELWILINK